jgi:hypothetical protein
MKPDSPVQQPQDRGFAAPRLADERDGRSFGNGERDALESLAARVVRELDILELDDAISDDEFGCVRLVLDVKILLKRVGRCLSERCLGEIQRRQSTHIEELHQLLAVNHRLIELAVDHAEIVERAVKVRRVSPRFTAFEFVLV